MNYLKAESKKLLENIKTMDFRTTFVLSSLPFIIFISIELANPYFYLSHFGSDRLMSRLYWFFTDGVILSVIPILIIKFVFKKKLSDFGFRIGDAKFGLITSAIFLGVMLIVVWFVSASKEFALAYPQGGSALRENLSLFLLYELSILVYMFGWEFIWRGYTLFGLYDKLGYYSILIQMIPFFILHRGKPEIELFASIFAGVILGIQALRSRSFIYCWLLHWLVMVSIDSISILRSNLNFYSIF
jgi:hypothetical protein